MKFNIKPSQVSVATYLKEHGPATVHEIVEKTGLPERGVKKAIHEIRKRHPLETYHVGTGASFNQVVYWWGSE